MFYISHDPILISTDFTQAILYGALEVLGSGELKKLLRLPEDRYLSLSDCGVQGLSSSVCMELLNAFIGQYGLITAQGICLRIGRATFQFLRRKHPEIIFNNSVEQRMRPLEERIMNELVNLTQWLQKNLACQIGMEKEKEDWIIRMKLFEKCHPEINMISFYFFNGILQECLEWMDSRHSYKIEMLSDLMGSLSSYSISICYQSIN